MCWRTGTAWWARGTRRWVMIAGPASHCRRRCGNWAWRILSLSSGGRRRLCMSEQNVASSTTATTTGQVEVEAVAWISKFVGGDGSTRKLFCESLRPGDTVRQVLRRLSGRFPELHKALWDAQTGELGEHIEVLVNDAV